MRIQNYAKQRGKAREGCLPWKCSAISMLRGAPSRVSGRTEMKTYGSAVDILAFRTLTGRKSLW